MQFLAWFHDIVTAGSDGGYSLGFVRIPNSARANISSNLEFVFASRNAAIVFK